MVRHLTLYTDSDRKFPRFGRVSYGEVASWNTNRSALSCNFSNLLRFVYHKTSKTQDSTWNLTRWKTCTPEYDIFRQGIWKLFLKHWFALMPLDTSEKHVRQISICYLTRYLIPLWMGPKILYYPAPRWKAIACHPGPGWYSGIYRDSRTCNHYQTRQWQY